VRPRQTSAAQAAAIFRQLPDAHQVSEGLWTYAPEAGYQNMVGYQYMLTLTADRAQIGEVIIHIGAPDFQTRQVAIRVATGETQELLRLFYRDQQIILIAAIPVGGRLSPHSPIAAINFVDPRPARPYDAVNWHGFIWPDRYPPPIRP
jgi:hypothetical protein